MQIEVCYEMIDEIVKEELANSLQGFRDYKEHYNTGSSPSPNVFSTNREEDIAEINKAIAAFEYVANYFGVEI